MRRVIVLLAAAAVSGAAVTPSFGSPQPDHGTYPVTAYPVPNRLYWVPGVPNCIDTGVEGVHKVSRSFRASTTGTLTLKLSGFTGDWDLAVVDAGGRHLGFGGRNDQVTGSSGTETVVARLHAGQQVSMVTCNNLSTQTMVLASYEFRRGIDAPPSRPDPKFHHLAGGQRANLREQVPINVVFLGFRPDAVPPAAFRESLPTVNRPRARIPALTYGVERPLGITYHYAYNIRYAPRTYEDKFFRHLAAVSSAAHLTAAQKTYNTQKQRRVTITNNSEIDAVDIERWLALHPPTGVDTRQDTVFFINWYGRRDFQFHVYRKTDEPRNPGGGTFGQDDSMALSAWGGTPPDDPDSGYHAIRRVWFYDLSAGPTYWTNNAVVDTRDADGDGVNEHGIPPSWEYGAFRPSAQLADDLAALTRYVAVDMLFTPSPLYDPALTPPALPSTVSVALNLFPIDASGGGTRSFDKDSFNASVRGLSAGFRGAGVAVQDPNSGGWRACLETWQGLLLTPSCQSSSYSSQANMFVAAAKSRPTVIQAAPPAEHKTAMQVFMGGSLASTVPFDECYAVTEDNYRDGTQSYVTGVIPTWCWPYVTNILIHEFGHYLGLSHVHDGYDYGDDVDYSGLQPEFAFTSVGDEVNSSMSYMELNNEFSQFDRDNLQRWLTAAYLTQTNMLLPKALAKAQKFGSALRHIDDLAGKASAAFSAHQYPEAQSDAEQAYAALRALLRAGGIPVSGSTTGYTLDEHPISGVASSSAWRDRFVDYLSPGRIPMCVPVHVSLTDPTCGFPARIGTRLP